MPLTEREIRRQAIFEKITKEHSAEELQDMLDEQVHEIFSQRASDLNNQGHIAQFFFLLDELGEAGMLKAFKTEKKVVEKCAKGCIHPAHEGSICGYTIGDGLVCFCGLPKIGGS
jgi:hypothetical protein